MKKFILFLIFSNSIFAWGFYAHKKIQTEAIKLLPKEIKPFFIDNKNFIIENSIAPDKWKFKDKSEGPKHFIDLDNYGKYPFTALPRNIDIAIEKYGEKQVLENGTVPWQILFFTEKLTAAFNSKNKNDILFYSSALGHYISDAHVPLHTTNNYDGQLTNQFGLHGRWETDLVKKFEIILKPENCDIIKNKKEKVFEIVLSSNLLVDKILNADKISLFDIKGKPNFKLNKKKKEFRYLKNYYNEFYNLCSIDLKKQMESSATITASFWLTAWIDSGMPDLSKL